jgi:MFS family permease
VFRRTRLAPLGPRFTRLLAASSCANLADGVFLTALPLLAIRLTRSPGLIAGLGVVDRLPWLLFALPAGAVADRFDRRRIMLGVQFLRAALVGLLGVLVVLHADSLVVLYLVAFILGTGETLFDTSAQSLITALVSKDDLPRANSRLYAAETVLNLFIGPPVGGLLAGIAIALAFTGSALAYLFAALALLSLRGSFKPKRVGEPTSIRQDIVEGLRYLARHRVLRTMALMTGVMNMTGTASFVLLPLYAVRPGPLGLTDAGYGVLMISLGIGGLVGAAVAAPLVRRVGRSRSLLISVALNGGPYLAPVLWTSAPLFFVVLVVSSSSALIWNVVAVSLRQRIVPDHLLGRINASYRLLAWGMIPLGAALGGVLASTFGIRSVFLFNAVATLGLLACAPILTDRALDAAEAEAEPPDAGPAGSESDGEGGIGVPDPAVRLEGVG